MSELDANVIVNGQKAVATVAQTGTVIEDGGAIDATSVIQTASGPQKVVKTYTVGGGGGGGGDQNIKAYHAPSATLDATLGVLIPNVDACTEQGLYNVDYSFESDGATITSNALLEVSETSMSGVSAIAQNLLINVGTELVYCTRNYISNTFTSWAGQNIPAELAKCLQNTATGTDSLTIAGNNGGYSNSINIGVGSWAQNQNAIAIGKNAKANTYGISIGGTSNNGNYSIVIGSYGCSASGSTAIAIGGYECHANAGNAIQLGYGTNTNANTFQVFSYQLLNSSGLIPIERITPVVKLTNNAFSVQDGTLYNGGEITRLEFIMPATIPVTFTIQLNFTSGATPTNYIGTSTPINYEGDDCSGGVFTPVANKRYQVLIASDGVNVNGYVIGR